LSAVTPIADKLLRRSECSDVPIADIALFDHLDSHRADV